MALLNCVIVFSMALNKELQILSKSKEEKEDDDGRYDFNFFIQAHFVFDNNQKHLKQTTKQRS